MLHTYLCVNYLRLLRFLSMFANQMIEIEIEIYSNILWLIPMKICFYCVCLPFTLNKQISQQKDIVTMFVCHLQKLTKLQFDAFCPEYWFHIYTTKYCRNRWFQFCVVIDYLFMWIRFFCNIFFSRLKLYLLNFELLSVFK